MAGMTGAKRRHQILENQIFRENLKCDGKQVSPGLSRKKQTAPLLFPKIFLKFTIRMCWMQKERACVPSLLGVVYEIERQTVFILDASAKPRADTS